MQRAILEKVAAHLANVAAHARVKRAYDRYLEKNAEPGIVDTAVTAFKNNPAAVGAGAGALLGGVLGGVVATVLMAKMILVSSRFRSARGRVSVHRRSSCVTWVMCSVGVRMGRMQCEGYK